MVIGSNEAKNDLIDILFALITKVKKRITIIIAWFVIIIADFGIFTILGLFLMGYDDHYNSSKGEYWSLASMNTTEKILYICYNTWIILNIIGLICIFIYLVQKIYKQVKKSQ